MGTKNTKSRIIIIMTIIIIIIIIIKDIER